MFSDRFCVLSVGSQESCNYTYFVKEKKDKNLAYMGNRPRSIYQYSNMAPRLSGQTSIFGVVFFVSKSLLGIERQLDCSVSSVIPLQRVNNDS